MMYSATVVVSFHPIFVTKIDRAYKVECFLRRSRPHTQRLLQCQVRICRVELTEEIEDKFPVTESRKFGKVTVSDVQLFGQCPAVNWRNLPKLITVFFSSAIPYATVTYF